MFKNKYLAKASERITEEERNLMVKYINNISSSNLVDKKVIDNGIIFLSILPDCISKEIMSLNITPYGTIVLDFEKESNLISVEIGETEIGFFTEFDDKENFVSNGVPFNGIIPDDLNSAFKKLFNH